LRVIVARVDSLTGKFKAACRTITSTAGFPAFIPRLLKPNRRRSVKHVDLATMNVDELWNLHEQLREILATKLDDEMHEMQRRLAEIDVKARRPYPKVHPKYRNPERPSETWSGRGLQPHWVRAQLRKGKKFDDLLISRSH
jgi:DNA-binding protein H-NS